MLKIKRGQSTAEYAIIIALVIGAAIAMQTYVKRSMQGGVKFAVDKMKKDATGTGQYEPYYLESSYNTTTKANIATENMTAAGQVERKTGVDAGGAAKTVERNGTQTIKDVSVAD